MNYQSLFYFMEAAKDLNFTQTAKRLYITQQALSDQIRKLEKHYETAFFERKPRLKLTYSGEQMLSFAKKVVQAEDILLSSIKFQEKVKRVKLTVAAASTRGVMMPTILRRYLPAYPNVIPSILTGSPDSLIPRLQLEHLDIYFGPFRQTQGEYVSEAVTRDELYFIIHRDLLRSIAGSDPEFLSQGIRRGLSLADVEPFPVTLSPVSTSARTFMEIAFQSQNASPNVLIETDSNETMFDVCISGFCGAFIMRELVYDRLRSNSFPSDVLCFPLRDIPTLNSYGVAYPKGVVPDYVSGFVDCCKIVLHDAVTTVDGFIATQVF